MKTSFEHSLRDLAFEFFSSQIRIEVYVTDASNNNVVLTEVLNHTILSRGLFNLCDFQV